MTVNLSKLKKGYTVKFRCGGEAVVDSFEFLRDDCIILWFKGRDGGVTTVFALDGTKAKLRLDQPFPDNPVVQDGTWSGIEAETHFDIIEIIPAAFDWDMIKQGDAFHFVFDDCTIWFLCEYPSGWIFTRDYDDPWKSKPLTFFCGPGNSKLIRNPEHDRGLK